MKYSVRNDIKRYHNLHENNPYIQIIEKKLNDELNKFCVECGNENPEYISINNGIFICSECVQNHFNFPKNISRILKNNIKVLTLDEIQYLLCGGNRALLNFINNEFPKLSQFPPYILYRTQAMVYYRQNLNYLINGGIAPIKPSLKYAYKVSNFINNLQSEFNSMKENVNNNFTISGSETFNTIQEEKRFFNSINNLNNFENYASQSNFNFSRGRNINIDDKNFNDRFINTNCNIEKNYDTNYIINKPRQINFQNNNNIIIGNLNTHHDLRQLNQGRLMTSHEKINDNDFKPKNKRKMECLTNQSTNYINNVHEVYTKPKLVLSPKIKINCLTINGISSQRNQSVVVDNNADELMEEKNKIMNKKLIKKRLNKNSSHDFYIMTQNRVSGIVNKNPKYIHKSLSQRNIKNESGKIMNKKIIHNYKDKKFYINTDQKYEILSKIKEMKNCNKNNIFKNDFDNNNSMNNKYTINNEKLITEQNRYTSEVESLPIKINLKNNNINKYKPKPKEIKVDLTKSHIINEKNYFSSDETKIKDDKNVTNKKNNKEIDKTNNNNNNNNKENDNTINNKNNNDKTNLCKHLSQTNITKESKEKNKKLLGDKINVKEVNKLSIRNKYKLKRKHN